MPLEHLLVDIDLRTGGKTFDFPPGPLLQEEFDELSRLLGVDVLQAEVEYFKRLQEKE